MSRSCGFVSCVHVGMVFDVGFGFGSGFRFVLCFGLCLGLGYSLGFRIVVFVIVGFVFVCFGLGFWAVVVSGFGLATTIWLPTCAPFPS